MLGTLENPYQLQEGEKISRNGVYLIPIDIYHSRDLCEGHSVSSTGLRLLINKSCFHYWDEYIKEPEEDEEQKEPEQKAHFSLGQAVHTLFLGEGDFFDKFSVRPNKWNAWRTKDSKKWRSEQIQAGKYVLLPSDLKKIEAMAASIARDRTIKQQGLLSGYVERSLIWKDQATGIWLKSRMDVIPTIENTLVDLKTAGASATDHYCQKAIYDNGYHIQMALGEMGMLKCLGRQIDEFILLFSETVKPHAYNIKPVDPRAIYLGLCQIRYALTKLAECLARDEWPTYEGSERTAYLPAYAMTRLEQDLETGLLPDIHNPHAHIREAAE